MSFAATVRHIATIPALRRRALITLALIGVYRLGAQLPAPGVDYAAINQCAATIADGSLMSAVNLFSGGALTQVSLLGLGVMPYITAAIIMQLLGVVIPRLGELRKEGATGQATITQYSRYLTVALAGISAAGLVYAASGTPSRLFPNCPSPVLATDGNLAVVVLVVALTAGSLLAMWLGEQITEHGFGNGISLILFSSIAVTLPAQMFSVSASQGYWMLAGVTAGVLVLLVAVTFVEQGQRRIPIGYDRTGTRHSTFMPFKVNSAGVVPVIYASSLLYMPMIVVGVTDADGAVGTWVQTYLVSGTHPIYIAAYVALVLLFTFFQVSITHDVRELTDQLNSAGGFVPGIRPGAETRSYLTYVLDRITAAGAVYLAAVAVLPLFVLSGVGGGSQLPLGGTALLILASVGLDTTKQIAAKVSEQAPLTAGVLPPAGLRSGASTDTSTGTGNRRGRSNRKASL